MPKIPKVTLDGTGNGTILLIEPALGINMDVLQEVGARWDKPRRRWKLPGSLWALEAVKDLLGDIQADTAALALSEVPTWEEGIVYHPRWTDLYDFQKDAARRLVGTYDQGYGQLLAMSPGLGKTATSIVAADIALSLPKAVRLVICPASLVATWRRELSRWAVDPDVWSVISYEGWIRGKLDESGPEIWDLAIIDESILMKSHRAKRTKKLHTQMADKGRRFNVVWLLSGSPISRYPDDLWSQLKMCRPKAFTSYWRFAERYCFVKENDWGPGKVVVGPRAKYNAAEENADLMHVVSQEDVLKLPDYFFEVVDVPLKGKQSTAYTDMLETFYAELEDGNEMEATNKIARMTRLQQIVSGIPNGAKHDILVQLVEDGIYELPLLVWTYWKDSAKVLAERLGVEAVNGDTPKSRRDLTIQRFAEGKSDILVLSLGVGKFGHTFTKTKTVAYVDKTFAADDYVQSLRRVRRIGLEHRPLVTSLVTPGTTDDLIEKNLEGKLGSIARISNANLLEMLRGIGKEVI